MVNKVNLKPDIDQAKILDTLSHKFKIFGNLKEMSSERDCTYLIQSSNKTIGVLKISNPTESLDTIDFQNSILDHLQKKNNGNVPKLIQTIDKKDSYFLEIESITYCFRVFRYLEGKLLSDINYLSEKNYQNLGKIFGQLDLDLCSYTGKARESSYQWNLYNVSKVIQSKIKFISSSEDQLLVKELVCKLENSLFKNIPNLPQSLIHNDGNDHNIVVSNYNFNENLINTEFGIIDFGDCAKTCRIFELAILIAYSILDKENPLQIAKNLLRGYFEKFKLDKLEVSMLFEAILARLMVSVCISSEHAFHSQKDPYLQVSAKPVWKLLKKFRCLSIEWVNELFLIEVGYSNLPSNSKKFNEWLKKESKKFSSVLKNNHDLNKALFMDLSVETTLVTELDKPYSSEELTRILNNYLKEHNTEIAIGRYLEPRLVYASDRFVDIDGEKRTIHLGVDIFTSPLEPVFAPLDGIVHSFTDNNNPLDYGPTIILKHNIADGKTFFTLYGHLSGDSIGSLQIGQVISKGQSFAKIGDRPGNGDWPPHLHFQVVLNLYGNYGNYQGVSTLSHLNINRWNSPDPSLFLGENLNASYPLDFYLEELLRDRKNNIGNSISLAYQNPLAIVRGYKQYLFDVFGDSYLDCINNVSHVGHSPQEITETIKNQTTLLNTNSRYLHKNRTEYAKKLLSKFPDSLNVCYFVCSGSEANELALRLARTNTGREDILVMDHAYHGNSNLLVDISPYKYKNKGGSGRKNFVHEILIPNCFYDNLDPEDPKSIREYTDKFSRKLEDLENEQINIAAFISEAFLGCGGQVPLPPGYLKSILPILKKHGALYIADEVQIGFGRLGKHFWGFEFQEVTPDIVTLGKPIGNGHPLACVVTTSEISEKFNNGMEYFNTFGGNPVSCAVGNKVLDIIQNQKLQQNAETIGNILISGFLNLKEKYPIIGDVRGSGLFLGIELVDSIKPIIPATKLAYYLVERFLQKKILLSTEGPFNNIIKIKPPLVFSEQDCNRLLFEFEQILEKEIYI